NVYVYFCRMLHFAQGLYFAVHFPKGVIFSPGNIATILWKHSVMLSLTIQKRLMISPKSRRETDGMSLKPSDNSRSYDYCFHRKIPQLILILMGTAVIE